MEEKETEASLVLQNNSSDIYCTKKAETFEERKELFNALETCDNLLNDCVGAVISLKDVYIEKREREFSEANEETGEVEEKKVNKYRTILFDENGTTYVTGSYGIFNAISKIILAFGEPARWQEPLKVEVIKRPLADNKQTLTLKVV